MRVKRGDKVKIIRGKDRGREGEVNRVLPRKARVFVSGVNISKKHAKPSARNKEGGIIEIQRPLPVENVVVICPHCQQTTRVGYRIDEREGKGRICRKCGENL